VDFSGAKADNATWVTLARLDGLSLRILSSRSSTRAELADLLASLPDETVAALDFPYSVPQQFAEFWAPLATEMPALWQEAANMDFEDFLELRDEFCSQNGEPLRRGDLYFPECYSCLHKFNPNMVPMTFRGMQMLHRLWGEGCRVPPLQDQGRSGPVLLESMPGAVINSFGLPHKGYKNGARRQELRQQILDNLSPRSGLVLENLEDFRLRYLESHDCLDSLVAAVAAALWTGDESLFRRPGDDENTAFTILRRNASPRVMDMSELSAARLEGWLYAPKKQPLRLCVK
jgi:hypothetical protein